MKNQELDELRKEIAVLKEQIEKLIIIHEDLLGEGEPPSNYEN